MTKRQLTLEMVQKYLGQEGKKYNGYVVFECPLCKAEGNDQKKHNLTKTKLMKQIAGSSLMLL